MKKKKWTPEEYRVWRERHEARLVDLQGHIERIKAELAAKQKPS